MTAVARPRAAGRRWLSRAAGRRGAIADAAGSERRDVRADRGLGLDLVRADRPAVDRRRRRQRHARSSTPAAARRKGRKDFAQNSTDFAISEIPYQGTDEPGNADTSNGRDVRLPADRRGRHGVHLPPEDRRPAGPQPAAVGRDDLQDLHQPDHQLERPGDHQGQQRPRLPVAADHPGGPLRRLRHDGAVHALDGQPVPARLAAVLRRHRPHVVLPAQGPRRSPRPAPTR